MHNFYHNHLISNERTHGDKKCVLHGFVSVDVRLPDSTNILAILHHVIVCIVCLFNLMTIDKPSGEFCGSFHRVTESEMPVHLQCLHQNLGMTFLICPCCFINSQYKRGTNTYEDDDI